MAEEKKSEILPLLAAGSIKYPEEYSKIHVNCRPPDDDDKKTSTGLENVELSVLFPEETKDVVPLIGGSIVKLALTAGSSIDTSSDALTGRYSDPIAKLAKYVKNNIPHVAKPKGKEHPFVSISDLAKVRVAINKALDDMPSLTTQWHEAGVPTLVLSRTKTKAYSNASALQKAIDKDKKARIKELGRPIGYFKYIPPQVLNLIFDALMNAPSDSGDDPKKYGMWKSEYYGISGDSFYAMSLKLKGEKKGGVFPLLKDPELVKILLDLFPIIRVKSSDITGGSRTLPNIGYYTSNDDSLYIKMPDLSGRDSNGDSQNIYGLGADVEGDINLCFELVKDVYKYAGKAFEFLPPPALEVKEGDTEYPNYSENYGPQPKDAEITILKNGIDKKTFKDYKFFLSPILSAGSSTSSRGLRTTSRGVEIFTAPVLTKPYLEKGEAVVTFPDKVRSELIYEFSKKTQNEGMEGYNRVFKNTKDVRGQQETEAAAKAGSLTHIEFADKRRSPSQDKYSYEFEELGPPMSESLVRAGIDSVVDLLGEANRPEILLGFRDGKAPERTNEAKVYDPKVYGAKTLLASNRPNIITDLKKMSQIPAAWIPLAIEGKDEDDYYTLKIPHEPGKGPLQPSSSLAIYNNMGLLKFALYAVDPMGQIIRAPGKNIRVAPMTPNLSYAKPDGFSGHDVPLSLGTKLAVSLDDPLATPSEAQPGIKLHGEGFVGMRKELLLNFYSDKAGTNLLTSVRHGMKFGVDQHEIRFRDIDDNNISIETKGSFGDILPALVGTFYMAVQLPTGTTSKTVPIYISKAGTRKDDLPAKGDIKIQFRDSFGLEVEGFDEGVHSIPVIQDSVNHASLTIKSETKTFDTSNAKAILYAYIAVLANEKNKDILTSDVGWIKDDGHKEKSILKMPIQTAVTKGAESYAEFYIPTALEWKYGTGDFKRDGARKATIRFPGTDHANMNLSRFTEFNNDLSAEHAAYILLTNSKLSSGSNLPKFDSSTGGSKKDTVNYDYAVIPIGSKGTCSDDDCNPAFASVPEILGFVAELPSNGGGSRIVSNIPKPSLIGNEIHKYIDGMKLDSLKTGGEQELRIISSDALDRLAIVFKGNEIPRMEKMHRASIGNKSLEDNCTSVNYVPKKNIVVANYKNITGIKSQGWTDVVMEKIDKRFKCSYDSTLYNRVTININPAEGEKEFLDEDGKLLTKKDLIISQFGDPESKKDLAHEFVGVADFVSPILTPPAGKALKNLSTVIFPGGNGEFTPLPLIKEKSYKYPPPGDPSSPWIALDNDAYYRFSNPIKVKPSLDLILGVSKSDGGNALVKGCALSDALVDPDGNPADEIIAINKFGNTSVAMGLMDMADAIKKAKKEAEEVLKNIKASIAEMKEGPEKEKAKEDLAKAETNYKEKSEEAETAIENAETSLSKKEADQAAMDAAMAGSQAAEGSTDGSAVDDLNDALGKAGDAADAALGAVADAAGAINDALSMFTKVTDQLSSMASIVNSIADGVEGAVTALGNRPDDFVKANLKYIYIDKDNVITSNSWIKRDDDAQFKLVTNYQFSQTSAIKFNTPEITGVQKDRAGIMYTPFGDNPFSKLTMKTGDTLFLQVIGAKADTKYEIAGKRVKPVKKHPSIGIFDTIEVKVPDMSSFSVFGTGDCITITATNSNEGRMRLGRQMGNDITLNLESDWNGRIFDDRNKEGPGGDLAKHLEDNAYLKFLMVKLGKVAGGTKESLQSFCDFSFHLTAELSLQLRNFRVLLVPIKVIFCIIDVICALLNPWRLAFAIIRLFLCLYDLILLLPQLAVPAMFLALLLHILNLLLCVILKILSWVNAINEIVTALARAIEHKNYPAIAALEETLNEHLFSLETDLSVLEPIITILNLFLQLLQLAFAFPCRVGSDDDDEACIDPSQLAGIILGKVAPTGAIAPNVLLPLAQSYTRLPPQDSGYYGNSPPEQRDNPGNIGVSGPLKHEITGSYFDGGVNTNQMGHWDVVVRPQDENNAIVARKTSDAGANIPNMMNMATGEMKTIQEEGFFKADADGDGRMDNINYPQLRTLYADHTPQGLDDFRSRDTGEYYGASQGYFDATFSLSYTRGTKDWGFFTGPDPRLVRFNFDSGGVTSDIAWWTWWLIFPIFWSKKRVGLMQTIDSQPMFMRKNDDGDLVVSSSAKDFVSPIDGFDNFLKKVGNGYQPKPLTVTFPLMEPGVNMETFDAEFTPKMVTKTFGNIPMIAIVDDEFNVYFVEQDGHNGGIAMSGNKIDSIHLKMLNKPSAPKHKTSRQKEIAYSNRKWWDFNSFKAETAAFLAQEKGSVAGSLDDWSENTSSTHNVSGYPMHIGGFGGHLEHHPVTNATYSSSNYYTSDGPKVDALGALDEDGTPEWNKDDNKYGVQRTGEAIMQSTANAMWLKGETVDNEEKIYYNGVLVKTILEGEYPTAGTGVGSGVNSPDGATTIDYILSTTSKYRYNKALHCIWAHEKFNSTATPGNPNRHDSTLDPDVLGTGGEIPENSAVHNPHGIDYALFPEKRIQTLRNKVVTFFLSTQAEDNSPYDDIYDGDGVNEEGPDDDWGDPYWPVNFGDMGDDPGTPGSRPPAGASPAEGSSKDENGNVYIHILHPKDMYRHPDYQDPDPASEFALNEDNPGRFEVEWSEEMDQNIPYPKLGMAYDHGGGSSWEQGDIGDSITAVKVYDFPQFYIVDMRQLADDIAAACGAAGPAELLMDLPGFEEPFEDNVQDMMDCMQAFMDHFSSEEEDDEGVPKGMIPQIRHKIGKGVLPGRVSVADVLEQYETLVECVNDQIDKSCRFVVNPLNTGFKLLGDEDLTPLPDYIDPEQADPGSLGSAGIIDELEFDDELAGFPSITGAMEYASGIGDTLIIEIEDKARVEFLPRDCYDDPMPKALDLTGKVEIEFVTDETGNAELITPYDDSTDLVIKDEEKYTMAVTAYSPGKVVIKGSICGVVIQAVTDKGIVSGLESDSDSDETELAESLEGCIEDAVDDGLGASSEAEDDSFAPGSLMKVDRLLTLLFVPKGAGGAGGGGMGGPGGLYGDGDRDASARSAKPSPQTSGTKLEN